jgi:hypothetical protein
MSWFPKFAFTFNLYRYNEVDGTCEDGFDQMACSACMRPGFYRLEGGCRKCPETDGTMTMIFIAIGVIIAAPILFKLSEQMKNFPSINIGISFSQYLGLFSVGLYNLNSVYP